MEAQEIYLSKVVEALARCTASEEFLATYLDKSSKPMLEASALQMRKALECAAFAAIAPNKARYEKFRSEAEKPADYRKDYNARTILQHLAKINPEFYPSPLLPPTQKNPGHWHFDRKQSGFLTKKRFESFYDRLGKYLHADNPWGKDKGAVNLVKDIPIVAAELRSLLSLHRTVVRTQNFQGVWVVEVPEDGRSPHIILGQASGEFLSVGG